jgi:hypothetical protein
MADLSIPGTRDEAIAQAATADWSALIGRIAALDHAWSSAADGLDQAEARSLIGEPESQDDDPWTVEQICNHVARSLSHGADTLSLLAVAKPADYDGRYALLDGEPSFGHVQATLAKGWTDLLAAAKTVAKQPERGPVIDTARGPMSARQLVGLITWHVDAHTTQIRSLRAAGPKSG